MPYNLPILFIILLMKLIIFENYAGEPHNHDNPNVQIQDVTYGKLGPFSL